MIERVAWSAEAEQGLSKALHGDEKIIKNEVETGNAALWRFQTKQTDGWAVVRVEKIAEQRQLVLVAGQGRGLIAGMEWLWREYQKRYGVTSIRTHVKNPALLKLYNRNKAGLAFKVKEIVLEGAPKNGRIEQQQ